MPKDDTLTPRLSAPHAPGLMGRLFGGVFGGAGRRRDLPAMHEEMFRIRGELALARAELEQIRAAVGRRDIATLEELLRAGNRREIEAMIRDRTQMVPLPDGTVLCRVLGRFKFYVDAADVAMAPHLLLDGYWQYWITEFLCRNLGRAETAVDIGAGYGYYSIIMADLVGAQGRVVAFEPNPWLHAIAARNLGVNGRDPALALHRSAVGEATGAPMRLRAALTGPRAGAFAAWFETQDGTTHLTAPAVALDDAEPGRADLVRVGASAAVEGAWAGMQQVLARSPAIRLLMEFRATDCADPGAFLAAVEKQFPLRYVDGDARAKPCTAEELLTRRPHATLYLSRTEPR
ncbi:MAG TPA: FkbM family methyltransferase [Acetobacteraceae bacterium]|nr:FkbM family methyltransferase [Acetobacteraceae bacterium]